MAEIRKGAGKPSQLRIIGGQWRGRKLTFHTAPGLRPTTDRIRETLFNWLAPPFTAPAARICSPAAARWAWRPCPRRRHCDFVDHSPAPARNSATPETLQARTRAHCHAAGQQFLARRKRPTTSFSSIPLSARQLVSPPARCWHSGLLAPGALVYVETGGAETAPQCPTAGSAPGKARRRGGLPPVLRRAGN